MGSVDRYTRSRRTHTTRGRLYRRERASNGTTDRNGFGGGQSALGARDRRRRDGQGRCQSGQVRIGGSIAVTRVIQSCRGQGILRQISHEITKQKG